MEINKKRILVLGAGRGQIGLINAAHELGYEAIAASIDGDYPGFKIADEKCIVDISNAKAVARAAKSLNIDGVVTAGMDLPLPALGAACEDCRLAGLNRKTAQLSANKLLMKDAFMKSGVKTARFIKASNSEEAIKATELLRLPLIVKPVDLGGSRGINIVFKEEELEDAFRNTMSATKKDYCIIEEYIDGYEVSATSMIVDGEVLFVLPMGDVRYGENDEIPVGHYVPLDCSSSINNEIKEQVVQAIKSLGIDNCAVNADLMIMNNEAYVLELTGRLGANAIPELTSMYYGVDIHKLIVETSVGKFEEVKKFEFEDKDDKVWYGQMLFSEKTGVLGKSTLGEAECEEWFFKNKGDKVNRFKNPGDCIGQVVFEGRNKIECENKAQELLNKVVVL